MNTKSIVKKNILIIFGISLLISSSILISQSFKDNKYNNNNINNENVINNSGSIDGIGVPYFYKERSIFRTTPQVLFVVIFSILMGFVFLFFPTEVKAIFCYNLNLKYLIGYLIFVLLFAFAIKYFHVKVFFYNHNFLFLNGIIFLLILFLFLRLWRINPSKRIIFFISILLCFYQGIGLLIELGNFFVPLFIHEGKWPLVDGNYIAIYDSFMNHKFTLGYTLFRLQNNFLLLFSLFFLFKLKLKE